MAVFGLEVYHMVKKLVLSVITAIYMDFFYMTLNFLFYLFFTVLCLILILKIMFIAVILVNTII